MKTANAYRESLFSICRPRGNKGKTQILFGLQAACLYDLRILAKKVHGKQ
jgi:hypothetical protein